VGTGYGVQTCNTVFRLHQLGYNIRVASNYGQQGAALDYNGVKQYGTSGLSEFGEDDLYSVVRNWRPHVLVTLFDIWIGAYSKSLGPDWLSKIHNRWVAWLPVDSEPVAQPVADQAGKAYKAVAMSMFGQQQLIKAGVKADYIPHGVDTAIFKPAAKPQANKAWLESIAVQLIPQIRQLLTRLILWWA
jgi:glycosyltransferase involved in cell wall biosynthesis